MGLNYDDLDDDDEIEVVLIEDFDVFLVSLRDAVCLTVAKGEIEDADLDKYMTLNQIRSIVNGYIDGTDEETGVPFMIEDSYEELVADVSAAFLGACLSKLAAADLIETAWDEKRAEQIFWRKEKKNDD